VPVEEVARVAQRVPVEDRVRVQEPVRSPNRMQIPAAAQVHDPVRVQQLARVQEPTVGQSPAAQDVEAARHSTVAVQEPAHSEFRFTDYSMFSAEPQREAIWAEPKAHRSWSSAALVGALVAALFFALGATVGRGTVDRWIAYLQGSTQSQGPRTVPPAVPEQPGMANSGKSNGTNSAGSAETPNSSAESLKAGESKANSTASSGGGANPGGSVDKERADARSSAPSESGSGRGGPAKKGEVGSTVAGGAANAIAGRRPLNSTENLTRGGHDTGDVVDPGRVPGEHSILVNAPDPGSPPFYVSLPGEAISASGSIAISAQRTLEILPVSSRGANRSERVIIGKLMAHSDPFYPAEARNRRMEGSVELKARIGRTGEVVAVTPVSGPGLLMSAAATAVREWRYEPTFINGDPAETLADITVVFRLP
jgi:TonB family protein